MYSWRKEKTQSKGEAASTSKKGSCRGGSQGLSPRLLSVALAVQLHQLKRRRWTAIGGVQGFLNTPPPRRLCGGGGVPASDGPKGVWLASSQPLGWTLGWVPSALRKAPV